MPLESASGHRNISLACSSGLNDSSDGTTEAPPTVATVAIRPVLARASHAFSPSTTTTGLLGTMASTLYSGRSATLIPFSPISPLQNHLNSLLCPSSDSYRTCSTTSPEGIVSAYRFTSCVCTKFVIGGAATGSSVIPMAFTMSQ